MAVCLDCTNTAYHVTEDIRWQDKSDYLFKFKYADLAHLHLSVKGEKLYHVAGGNHILIHPIYLRGK